MGHTSNNVRQVSFRGRNDDGTPSTATYKAAENTNWNQRLDENFRCRFEVNEASGNNADNATYRVEYQINGGGWNVVNASSAIKIVDSAGISSSTDNVNRLTTAATTFQGGAVMEFSDGVTNDGNAFVLTLLASNHYELEFALLIDSAQVSVGATVQLRVSRQTLGVLDGYDQTPSITVQAARNLVQRGVRGRNDDGASTATWKAAENTSWVQNADEVFRARFEIENQTSNNYGPESFSLEARVNGGSWIPVNFSTSNPVYVEDSAFYTAGSENQEIGGAGDRLTSSALSIQGGWVLSDDRILDSKTLTANLHTEIEYTLVVSHLAGLAHGDTIELRVVDSVGALTTYANYATLTVNSPRTQKSYRGRNDDGDESGATWKEAENTEWAQAFDETFRVRFEIEAGSLNWVSNHNLQFRVDGGSWVTVTGGTDVQDDVSAFKASGIYSDNVNRLATATSTFNQGKFIVDNTNPGSFTITKLQHAEVEWTLLMPSGGGISEGSTVELRMVRSGPTAYEAYDQLATFTAGGGTTVGGDGEATGSSTVAADGGATAQAEGAAAGVSTPVATGQSTAQAEGAADGSSTTAADGARVISAEAAASGSSSVGADAAFVSGGEGAAAGSSSVSADALTIGAATAMAAGISSVDASSSSFAGTLAAAAGVAVVTAVAAAFALASGSSAGASTVAATSSAIEQAEGTAAGLSTTSAAGAAFDLVEASTAGSSSVDAIGSALAGAEGASAGLGTADAVGQAIGTTEATAAGSSTVAADGEDAGGFGSEATASGSSLVAAEGAALVPSDAAALGSSATTAEGGAVAEGVASAAGASTVAAVGESTSSALASSLGASTVAADSAGVAQAEAAAVGTATVAASGSALSATEAAAAGSSVVAGEGVALTTSEASSSGSSTVAGDGEDAAAGGATGTAAGLSTVAAAGGAIFSAEAASAGDSTAAASAAAPSLTEAAAGGNSATAAEGAAVAPAEGAAAGSSTVAAVGDFDLTGSEASAVGSSSVAAIGSAIVAATGAATGSSSVAANAESASLLPPEERTAVISATPEDRMALALVEPGTRRIIVQA